MSGFSAVWLAHMVWDHGVGGSNPSTPTNMKAVQHLDCTAFLFYSLKKLVNGIENSCDKLYSRVRDESVFPLSILLICVSENFS